MNNTNTNTQQNKNQNELGALWKKKSKTGLSFLSGYITDHDGQKTDVVVFANDKKSNERAPDYRLYISKPFNKQEGGQSQQSVVKKVEKKVVAQVIEEDEDEIL
jgi:uncharacterized protein (DUF736 family)